MNVQKLKSLYIEMLKFEAKATFCVEKKKSAVCLHRMDVIKFILVFI